MSDISINTEISIPSFGISNEFTDQVRDSYWIRVLFHGLLVGCIKDGQLQVGALKDVAHHNIAIRVYEKGNDTPICERILSPTDHISLQVSAPLSQGVSQYHVPLVDIDLDRASYENQEFRHDFRWLIDFEKIYKTNGKPIKKKRDKLSPRFQLNSGILYTLVRSIPLNLKKDGIPDPEPFGRSAQIFAANIYRMPGSKAKFTIDDKPVLPIGHLSSDHQYDIVFSNDCDSEDTIKIGSEVDTSELNKAFDVEEQIKLVCGADPVSDYEIKWWEKEKNGIDFGAYLKNTYDTHDSSKEKLILVTRVDPCGEAFLGSSNGLDENSNA